MWPVLDEEYDMGHCDHPTVLVAHQRDDSLLASKQVGLQYSHRVHPRPGQSSTQRSTDEMRL